MHSNENTARIESDEEVCVLSLELHADPEAENPREWDNLGVMVCAEHRNYTLGDEDGFSKAQDVVREHYSEAFLEDYDLDHHPHVYRLMENIKDVVMLPLYLYDHSGITMSTAPFSCPWDSGQVGFIFVTKEALRKEYGWKRITPKRMEQIYKYLSGEVETYDQYLRGDIYYFLAKEDDDVVDSCSGFFGSDPTKNGMMDHLSEPFKKLAQEGKYELVYG